MKKYIFKTNATMKDYNRQKWWIDGNIITEKHIQAENMTEALKTYQKAVKDKHCISISDNALKHKEPMYIDTEDGSKQVGFVITAKTDFQDDRSGKWTAQYIDLWVDILTVIDTEF